MLRKPAVAGQFYPMDGKILAREVVSFLGEQPLEKEEAKGIVSPHAGYMYSGSVAGAVLARVSIPDDVIILGPNHHGMGARFAIMAEGSWHTPLGDVPLNGGLAQLIIEHTRGVQDDYQAHLYEHSLEVQVPFLQVLNSNVRLVPIALGHAGWSQCQEIGHGLAQAIHEYGKKVLILASSDMTHYESDSSARAKDKMAIERILALDPEGLLETVGKFDITMCGVIPATIMLIASKILGAKQAELVKYTTSAEVSGDYFQVVGYAGIYVK